MATVTEEPVAKEEAVIDGPEEGEEETLASIKQELDELMAKLDSGTELGADLEADLEKVKELTEKMKTLAEVTDAAQTSEPEQGLAEEQDLVDEEKPTIENENRPTPPWWTLECRRAINARRNAMRSFSKNATQENLENFRKMRHEARNVIRQAQEIWKEKRAEAGGDDADKSKSGVEGTKETGWGLAEKGFTHCIRVKGLHPRYIKDLRLLIQNVIGMGLVKFVPAPRNSVYVGISFSTKEHLDEAIKILSDSPLGLKLQIETPDGEIIAGGSLEGSEQTDPMILLQDALQDGGPTSEEEYQKQIEWKEQVTTNSLRTLSQVLEREITVVMKDRTEGFLWKMEKLRPCPLTETLSDRYQTFSGVDDATGQADLGYRAFGSNVTSRVVRSPHVRKVVEVMKHFMLSSGKELYNHQDKSGFWLSLVVRSNYAGEIMLLVTVRTKGEEEANKEFDIFKPRFEEYFGEGGAGSDCNIVSIHMKASYQHTRALVKHMYGTEYLEEMAAGLRVQIFNKTYFWSNPIGVNLLCETIAEAMELTDETGVVELGCSTGIIGMYIAKRCKTVFELDKLGTSLGQAKSNAKLNEIENMQFVECNNFDTLPSHIKTMLKGYKRVCALLNDTSNNARTTVEMLLIRHLQAVERVIYVMMVNKDCVRNILALCNPEGGTPFVIVKVIPLDITPSIIHSEVVVVLARPKVLPGLTEVITPKPGPPITAPEKSQNYWKYGAATGSKRKWWDSNQNAGGGEKGRSGKRKNAGWGNAPALNNSRYNRPGQGLTGIGSRIQMALTQTLQGIPLGAAVDPNAAVKLEEVIVSAIKKAGVLDKGPNMGGGGGGVGGGGWGGNYGNYSGYPAGNGYGFQGPPSAGGGGYGGYNMSGAGYNNTWRGYGNTGQGWGSGGGAGGQMGWGNTSGNATQSWGTGTGTWRSGAGTGMGNNMGQGGPRYNY
uniref:tRNA (uracil(54)-C(5))-methyltransferase n=1 Tax=Timema poppense TaxID=170557 RepID=A0A7R9GUP6_TIMPO|nr:unnamed protein product [Timema poppensis]